MIIQYIKIPFSSAVFISKTTRQIRCYTKHDKEKNSFQGLKPVTACQHIAHSHPHYPHKKPPRPHYGQFMLRLYQVTRPLYNQNSCSVCIYKLMVAFILHKLRVITWMRERKLEWGSEDAAAQVGQSVVISTENIS